MSKFHIFGALTERTIASFSVFKLVCKFYIWKYEYLVFRLNLDLYEEIQHEFIYVLKNTNTYPIKINLKYSNIYLFFWWLKN